MDLSQYHTTLAHVTPRGRVHYGSVDQHAETSSDASHSPSYTITPRDSSPVTSRRVDVMCLYSISLSNPNHTTQVCLKNTPVFQTIETLKLTTITTGSSELNGRRPAYQSGRPGL